MTQMKKAALAGSPLDAVYPILWLDGLVIKVHQGKQVINKSVHVVLGVNLRGEKEVLSFKPS
jgi:transposase-like protein